MRRRLSSNLLFVGGAAAAALVLTFLRPTPQGLSDEVHAKPGDPSSSVKQKHNLRALKVFNRTLVRVRDRYVDTGRINPKEMLYEALDSVQFDIPEVLVDPDRDNSKVSVTVNDKKKVFSTSDVDSPWRLSGKLKEIFGFIEQNMNPGADLAAVEYAAVNGMLSTLDPHSSLLDPDLAAEMDVNTSGKFGGLGILIGMRDRKLVVIRPFKGTPAFEAGIKADDHIYKIDSEITENLTVNEAADRMRGEPGTDVVLWIKREGESGTLRFPLTRDNIRVPSVDSKLISEGGANLGYFKLKQFAATTSTEVAKAMKDLRAEGAKGWIMDLRGNPGGLLEQAISVSDLFLDSGTVVTTVSGKERESRRASRGGGTDTRLPIVVLIDRNSASASEIVAGALKNNERALTIGTTSFGKGSVQILYDNDDGSKLKLTIAEYLTPKDLSIQSVGIVPDVELFRMYVPDKNDNPRDYLRMVRPRLTHGEKDLKASLRSKYAKKPMKPDFRLPYVYVAPEQPAKKDEGEGDDETPVPDDDDPDPDADGDEVRIDFEINLASELLRQAGASSRGGMLKKAKALLGRRQAAETAKLAAKLAKLGVDWSAGDSASTASLAASFQIEGHKTTLRAGETLKLTGTVTNNGTTPAYRVHAKVASASYLFNDAELVFGKIEPGQSRTWTTQLRVPDAALDGYVVLDFDMSSGGKSAKEKSLDIKPSPLRFRVEAAERPVFSYTHQLLDQGNGDGLVQRGERYKLLVTVKNTGAGVSEETSAVLRNASGTAVDLKKARFELGELKPGDEKTVEFEFEATSGGRENELVVELMVNDWHLRESVQEKLKYPVATNKADGPTAISGTIEVRASEALLYEGASMTANAIGSATKGATFEATGRLGDWFRVKDPSGRPAFIHASTSKRSNRRASGKRFTALWQVTPPTLALTIPSYAVSGSTYNLRGAVKDDTRVEDVYVFVSNREAKIDNRKVFYRSNRGAKTPTALDFVGELPLWPGSNLVTVVARENGQVKTGKTFTLYRDDGVKRADLTP